MKSQIQFFLATLVGFGFLITTEVTCAPQGPLPNQGLIGVGNQWFTGLLSAVNAAAGGFSNGAATGFQTAGNTAQDLFNGGLNGYSAVSGGLVNGFQTLFGVPRSTTTTTTTPCPWCPWLIGTPSPDNTR